jgi:hypothetical protein
VPPTIRLQSFGWISCSSVGYNANRSQGPHVAVQQKDPRDFHGGRVSYDETGRRRHRLCNTEPCFITRFPWSRIEGGALRLPAAESRMRAAGLGTNVKPLAHLGSQQHDRESCAAGGRRVVFETTRRPVDCCWGVYARIGKRFASEPQLGRLDPAIVSDWLLHRIHCSGDINNLAARSGGTTWF